MPATNNLQGRDVWLRGTDELGRVTFSDHRVWDVGIFMLAREMEATALNAKKDSTLASVEQITEDRFRAKA